MVASAVRITTKQTDEAATRTRLPWQERAFAYYDLVGEIWYAAQFYARALSKLSLNLTIDGDTDDETIVEDPALSDYVARIQDPGGGTANLLGAYGRLKFLTGECFLLVTTADDDSESWEMLSCDEFRVTKGGQYERFRLPNSTPTLINAQDDGEWEPVAGKAVAYRFWTRHPRYSNIADGPMRGVLDLCEELLILTRAVRARGRSRLAGAGILIIPDEVSFPADTPNGDEDPKRDPFLEDLTDSMVAGISDEGSASAVVPLLVRAGAEYVDKFVHLQIHDPAQTYPETGLRMECIQRIALGLDMPPEVLLGKADANHWSAWQIDEDTYKAHIEPVAKQMADDFTSGYLRPSLRAAGVANPERYSVGYDPSALLVAPDRVSDAKDLHDRYAISDDALREVAGFDDADAPDDDEWVRRVGVKMNNATLATEGLDVELPAPPPVVMPGAPPPAAEAPADGEEDTGPGGVKKAPPEQDDQQEAASVPTPIMLASSLIAERAREAAGARLRSRYARDRAIAKLLDGVPNSEVGVILAEHLNGDLGEILAERSNLVAGASECFRAELLRWGLSPGDVEMVIAMAEQTAAEGLFGAAVAR